ncbi:hypothetical protein [Caloranaerobacter sp. DY30410]
MNDISIWVAVQFYKSQGIITIVHDGKIVGYMSEKAHLVAAR